MAAADYRMMTDATGQDLVAALQNIAPLQVAPLVVSIPTGQWSGSGSDYYITVNASNMTANSILVPCYDADSRSRLNGPVWCIPAAGSFTIHTSAIPSGTVTILVQIPGTMGEAQYQVLADVYSKSQAVAKADLVNNLTSGGTTVPLSAEMGKTLNSKLTPQTMTVNYSGSVFGTHSVGAIKHNRLLHIFGYFANSSNTNAGIVAVVNSCYPVGTVGSNALPVQCDDGSVQYLSFESANNNLTIKTPTTLTANKYVRFDGFIECSQ